MKKGICMCGLIREEYNTYELFNYYTEIVYNVLGL